MKFHITGGYDDSWTAAFDQEIEADTVKEACEKFIAGTYDGTIQCQPRSFDPGETYIFEMSGPDGPVPVPPEHSHERAFLGAHHWADLKLVLGVAGHLTEGEVEEILAGDENLNIGTEVDFFGSVARLLAMVQGQKIEPPSLYEAARPLLDAMEEAVVQIRQEIKSRSTTITDKEHAFASDLLVIGTGIKRLQTACAPGLCGREDVHADSHRNSEGKEDL